jgi:hypothetical protein
VRITKEFVRKGKITRQRKTKLGMSRLDEDADILVINETTAPEEPEEEIPEGPSEPVSIPDILSSVQRDRAPATQEDVERQLDNLRPARYDYDETHYVTTTEFIRLFGALSRGFTYGQLSAYYSARKQLKRDVLFKAVKATLRATKRSDWHPTITNIERRLPGIEINEKRKKAGTSLRKATLVDKVLRDVWKLELLEEIEAPGELELRLENWELKLLQAGGMYLR